MTDGPTPSQLIDLKIESLPDWRGETFARLRKLIHEADPQVEETWKWRGVPVFEHGGILTTCEVYKAAVKLTFAKGASLPDPAGLFNSSLEGNTRRAIDIAEGTMVDETAFKALVRAAVALNLAKKKK
ncbi:MAG: DUF1801 domain-containing protein [Caulobacteraceae bacterium]|nr:MAG: DUF1801 domain-containing protein [Caulobacteraceae bacterium]